MASQQHGADMPRELTGAAGDAAVTAQLRRQGLYALEGARKLRLVVREHHALRQHVGDDLEALDLVGRERHAVAVHPLARPGIEAYIDFRAFRSGEDAGHERRDLPEE